MCCFSHWTDALIAILLRNGCGLGFYSDWVTWTHWGVTAQFLEPLIHLDSLGGVKKTSTVRMPGVAEHLD